MSTTQQSYKDLSSESDQSRCGCCVQFVGHVVGFLVSNVGLLSLVVSYVLLGAMVFEALEKEHELSVKRNVSLNRDAFTERLWQLTRDMSVLKEANWSQMAADELQSFEKSVIIAMKERGWDGDEDESSVNWTFAGAVFYAITVITTIGYGHVAPKTAVAKIVTIFYAIVGIPLTVLCWSNLGDAMAKAFRFCYWRILCYLCTKRPNQRRRRRLMRQQARLPVVVRQPSTTSRPAMRRLNADSFNSIYDSDRFNCEEISIDETLGTTTNNAGIDGNNDAITITSITDSQNMEERKQKRPKRTGALDAGEVRAEPHTNVRGPSRLHPLPEEESLTDVSMSYAYYPEPAYLMDYEDDYAHKSVPLWLSFFIVLAYIVWGAYLFQDWEGWSLLDSSYFCFITLTTIGFGDLVPDQRSELGEQKLVLSSLYILVGIAMIAMSFNLVQAQVIGYFKEIGRQLGIIPDNEEDDNY